MNIKRLDWDSGFFGLRIGRADISSQEEGRAMVRRKADAKNDFDLVYVFSSHGVGFSDANAKLVDEKVVYALSGDVLSEENPNVVLWSPSQGVTDDLLHLALVSGKYSRFRLDEAFPKGSYERLYAQWIEQSVSHTMASEVFCYMLGDVPRGLVTLDRRNDEGTIGLVAIHEECQNKGIGSAMMRHVVHYARQFNCKRLTVATQLQNVPACKLYEKNGFEMKSVTDVWHWWMNNNCKYMNINKLPTPPQLSLPIQSSPLTVHNNAYTFGVQWYSWVENISSCPVGFVASITGTSFSHCPNLGIVYNVVAKSVDFSMTSFFAMHLVVFFRKEEMYGK